MSSKKKINAKVICFSDGIYKLYKDENDTHNKFAFVVSERK